MPKLHEDILDPEIHEPKGFAGAANNTALTKNASGDLEFVLTSTIGGGDQGPVGPAGPSLSAWVTATGYVVGDTLYSAEADSTLNKIYRCTVTHTSGASLLADIANWQELSESELDHTALTNIGTKTHATLDTEVDLNTAKVSADGLVTTHSDVTDAGSGAIITTGERNAIGIDETARLTLSTGWVVGCVVTVNVDPAKFDMTSGTVFHVDHTTTPGTPILTQVAVNAVTAGVVANIGTQTSTYLSIDISGAIVQTSTRSNPIQRRDRVEIAALAHQNLTTILNVQNQPEYVGDSNNQFNDLLQALGFFSISGNGISGITSTLTVKKDAGTGFARNANSQVSLKDPHTVVLDEQDPAVFTQILQDGTVIQAASSTLDPTNYDVNGVLTAVPGNNATATLGRVYLFPSNALVYMFGQETFASLAAAVNAAGTESFNAPDAVAIEGLLVARIAMRKDATDTTDISEVGIVAAAGVATGGGTVNTLQASYDVSSTPEVVVDATRGALTVRDALTPIAAPLLEVQNNSGTAEYLSVSVTELKTVTQAYSAQNALADGTNIATNCALGNVHSVTLAGNRTLDNPTNLKAGATYLWMFTQDGTGSRTLAYGTVFKFPGGLTPTLSIGIGAVDILSGVSDGTNVYCNLLGDFS